LVPQQTQLQGVCLLQHGLLVQVLQQHLLAL
jgi:hypothetical protein